MKDFFKKNFYLILLFALFFITVVVWGYSWFCIDNYVSPSHMFINHNTSQNDAEKIAYEVRAQFGDKFGAVNSLFSALAFAAIIVTMLMQKNELHLQRDELKETRFIMKSQSDTLYQQRFEGSFFQMLATYQHYMCLEASSGETYRFHVAEAFTELMSALDASGLDLTEIRVEDILSYLENIWTRERHMLYSQYDLLCQILKFIDDAKVENKDIYVTAIKSYATGTEYHLFIIMCLLPEHKAFRDVVVRLGFLDKQKLSSKLWFLIDAYYAE